MSEDRKPKKRWEGLEQADEKPYSTACGAYGCPLSGTVSRSTGKSDDWMCHIHAGKNSYAWSEITFRLNNQLKTVVDLWLMQRKAFALMTTHFKPVLQELEQKGLAELLPLSDETMRSWHYRVDKYLTDAAYRGIEQGSYESGKKTSTVYDVMDAIKNWLRKKSA